MRGLLLILTWINCKLNVYSRTTSLEKSPDYTCSVCKLAAFCSISHRFALVCDVAKCKRKRPNG